jgi:hypothetical protein
MCDDSHRNVEHFGIPRFQQENKIIPTTEHAILQFELKYDI